MPIEKKDILIIARKRGFWTSQVCREIFPRRILLRSKPTQFEQFLFAIIGLFFIWLRKPQILILGTSTRIVYWYARLRRRGWFTNLKIITDCQYLSAEIAEHLDRIVVYSSGEIEQYPENLRKKFNFLPYPSKTELTDVKVSDMKEDYIFCGGSNMRDHNSFLKAIDGLSVKAVVITDKNLPLHIPKNCKAYGRMPLGEYMNFMANSLFVAVPLFPSKLPHGHCDISSALSLGKIVITTRNSSVDGYIEEDMNGFLVDPEDVAGYKYAIKKLLEDKELFNRMSEYAKKHEKDFSYGVYAEKILNICNETAKYNFENK